MCGAALSQQKSEVTTVPLVAIIEDSAQLVMTPAHKRSFCQEVARAVK